MLLFECKMSPIGPCIRTLCPELMVLFGKIIELVWGGTWLEERCHQEGGLRVCTVWSHFLFFISRLLRRCDGLASCSYNRAFPVMMGCIPKGKPKQTFFPVGFHQHALLQQWEINLRHRPYWHCSFETTLGYGMHACSWVQSMGVLTWMMQF